MSSFTPATSYIENRLIDAVRRTAALHKSGNAVDLDKALASSLSNAGVPASFAKTAAHAANKSLSVAHFTKTAEDARALEFPLFSPERVESLMMGTENEEVDLDEDLLTTAEAVSDQPGYMVTKAAMAKIAAVINETFKAAPMENNLTVAEFQTKVANCMERLTRDMEDVIPACHTLHELYNLQKAAVANHYKGHERQIGQALIKNASRVLPVLVGAGIPADEIPLQAFCREEPSLVADFVKSAGKTRENLYALLCGVGHSIYHLADLEKTAKFVEERYKEGIAAAGSEAWELPMSKLAESAGYVDAIVDAPSALAGSLIGGVTGGVQGFGEVGDKLKAYKDWRAGNTGESYSKVLDAEFMLRDRKLDRLAAWADVMADPALKGYKATQLHSVVNRVMDTNRGLEAPGNRELLRANVKRALAQSGELSTADISALSKTLSDAKKSEGSIRDKVVGEATAKGYGESAGTAFRDIADSFAAAPSLLRDAMEASTKAIDQSSKNSDTLRKTYNEGIESIGKQKDLALKDAQNKATVEKLQAEAEAARRRGDLDAAKAAEVKIRVALRLDEDRRRKSDAAMTEAEKSPIQGE